MTIVDMVEVWKRQRIMAFSIPRMNRQSLRITKYIKHIYSGLPVFLFSHSMGTLVARGYLKKI